MPRGKKAAPPVNGGIELAEAVSWEKVLEVVKENSDGRALVPERGEQYRNANEVRVASEEIARLTAERDAAIARAERAEAKVAYQRQSIRDLEAKLRANGL